MTQPKPKSSSETLNEQQTVAKREEQIQKAHNDRIALIVTLTSTMVAIVAAFAAVWSGYEAHVTRIEDERPFIAVDITDSVESSQPSITDFFPAHARIVGFGKTPAENLVATCAIVPRSRETKISWSPKNQYPKLTFPFVLPSRSLPLPCTIAGDPKTTGATGAPGQFQYIEFGVVEYQDDAGRAYQTPFCQVITLNGGGAPYKSDPPADIDKCPPDVGLPKLR